MPRVVLRISGWEKVEEIGSTSFARGEVLVSHIPPLFSMAAPTPDMGIKTYRFEATGAEKNGLPVFECFA